LISHVACWRHCSRYDSVQPHLLDPGEMRCDR
jgi:hypothetical protein